MTFNETTSWTDFKEKKKRKVNFVYSMSLEYANLKNDSHTNDRDPI